MPTIAMLDGTGSCVVMSRRHIENLDFATAGRAAWEISSSETVWPRAFGCERQIKWNQEVESGHFVLLRRPGF